MGKKADIIIVHDWIGTQGNIPDEVLKAVDRMMARNQKRYVAKKTPDEIIHEQHASFFARVSKTDTCWLWVGCKEPRNGYGMQWFRGKNHRAHRVSWTIHHGDIPADLCVLHHCDNPPCVNPAHLFLGTHKDNADDKIKKGRDYKGERHQWYGRRGTRHPLAKLTDDDARAIRTMYADRKIRLIDIAKRFGVGMVQINRIARGLSWKNITDPPPCKGRYERPSQKKPVVSS